MPDPSPNTALGSLRVIDITDEKGVYCAKLLADLGADTIKIEPPGGHPTRNIGPFIDNIPHPERSLHWFHYNTNKRSITLDINQLEGQKLCRQLVKTADIVVESFQPGVLAGLGLGYDDLKAANPGIIMVSLTGFGQTGPYRDFQTSDIVSWAMSGFMYTCGYPWTPPLRPYGNQSYHAVSNYGAVGALAAVFNRYVTGEGAHIDISMQEAVAAISEHSNMYYVHDHVVHKRRPNEHTHGPGAFRRFKAKDGWVDVTPSYGPRWDAMVAWMAEEGMAGDLAHEKWREQKYHRAHVTEAYPIIEAWTMTHEREEFFRESQKRRLPFACVRTVPEVIADEQYQAREYFVPIEYPEIGRTLVDAGAPYKMSGTPWSVRRRAPLIGEHNLEIYRDKLGLSEAELIVLKEAAVI